MKKFTASILILKTLTSTNFTTTLSLTTKATDLGESIIYLIIYLITSIETL